MCVVILITLIMGLVMVFVVFEVEVVMIGISRGECGSIDDIASAIS